MKTIEDRLDAIEKHLGITEQRDTEYVWIYKPALRFAIETDEGKNPEIFRVKKSLLDFEFDSQGDMYPLGAMPPMEYISKHNIFNSLDELKEEIQRRFQRALDNVIHVEKIYD